MKSRSRIAIAALCLLAGLAATLGATQTGPGTSWRNADGATIPESPGFVPPVLKSTLEVTHPPGDTKGHHEAWIEVVVGLGGRPAAVGILRSDCPEFTEAALVAAEGATFEPAQLAGRPIAVRYELRFTHTAK